MLIGCGATAVALSFLPELAQSLGFLLPTYLSILLNFPVATAAVLAIVWEWYVNASSDANPPAASIGSHPDGN